jgi:hypothetical protein
MRYRTKPFVIDAVHYEGAIETVIEEFPECDIREASHSRAKVYDFLQDTWVLVNYGDYIIKGMKGEFYPCDPTVFETKYEEDK